MTYLTELSLNLMTLGDTTNQFRSAAKGTPEILAGIGVRYGIVAFGVQKL